ncbi:hypothetical protein DFH28DRAFT_831162, partial [Melampsora americana]
PSIQKPSLYLNKAISNLVEEKYKQQAGDSKEFTHLRYAAATCDPDVFTPM